MLEWALLVAMASLATLAFFYLFHNTPTTIATSTASKVPQRKPSKEKHAKIVEKKTEKQKKQPKKDADEGKFDDIVIPKVAEEETEIFRHFREKTNETPVVMKEKKVKVERVMPTKKQIERDLQQGFVLVTKKGPPPLTQEQRKEREEARKREEAEQERKEKEQQDRIKKQLKDRVEKPVMLQKEVPHEVLKSVLAKQKAEKFAETEKRQRIGGGVVRSFVAPIKSDDTPKIWGASLPSDEGLNAVGGSFEDQHEDPNYPRL
jgi:hypothetical protein